jgi:hypothetical protein
VKRARTIADSLLARALLASFVAYMYLSPWCFPYGIKAVQRIKSGTAIFVGAPAYLVYKFVFVIFNR